MSGAGHKRVVTANRSQIELRAMDLESLIATDHPARSIWEAIETLDLSKFYEPIKAVEHNSGRPATDPKVLVALWLFATSQGVGSARELERLCSEHHAYQWLRGGVPMNYHTLSDFRTGHEEALDDLFTQILAVLIKAKLVDLKRVSQDGMRVRASAGAASFRRRKKLKDYMKEARRQVSEVKKQADDPTVSARVQAAEERAASDRKERVGRALEELKKVEVQRANQHGGRKSQSEPRASITDPDARRMRMPDGGFRPGYNVQLATETKGHVILGVQVSNMGSDAGLAPPMLDEVERRTGQRPREYLVDGGFTDKKSVEHFEDLGVVFYGPTKNRPGEDPAAPKPGDTEAVRRWRSRMQTSEAKKIYKDRASTSERANADLRIQRTLDRMSVRGTQKVFSVALWNAITYNILRWVSLSDAMV